MQKCVCMYEYTVYLYLLHTVTNELDFGGIWDEDSLYLHDAVDIWLVFEFEWLTGSIPATGYFRIM